MWRPIYNCLDLLRPNYFIELFRTLWTTIATQGFLRWNLVLRFFHRLFFEALIHIQKLVIWPNCFDKKCCIGSKVSINVEKNWVLLSLLSAKWPQKGVFLYSYALQWSKSYWYRCVQGDVWNILREKKRSEMLGFSINWRFYFCDRKI